MESRKSPSSQERANQEKQQKREDVSKDVRRAQAIIENRNVREGDWRDEALCSAADPELFDTSHALKDQIEKARAYCGACKVSDSCLRHILDHPDNTGTMMWAGYTPEQLKAIRRRIGRDTLSRLAQRRNG